MSSDSGNSSKVSQIKLLKKKMSLKFKELYYRRFGEFRIIHVTYGNPKSKDKPIVTEDEKKFSKLTDAQLEKSLKKDEVLLSKLELKRKISLLNKEMISKQTSSFTDKKQKAKLITRILNLITVNDIGKMIERLKHIFGISNIRELLVMIATLLVIAKALGLLPFGDKYTKKYLMQECVI